VIIALCDEEVKNQVKGLPNYKEWDKKLDSMSILKEIKIIVYTGGSNNQHAKYSKARALMNLMDIRQDKHQDIQDFRDQYLAIYKVCKELGLRIGRCNEDAKAILKQEGVEDPTKEPIKGALDRAEEELHAIIFLYKTDQQKYGKYIEDIQNDVLHKKDPIPKTVDDVCHMLVGWKNQYGGKYNRFLKANDGIAFTTTTNENTKKTKEKRRRLHATSASKKGITRTNVLRKKKTSQKKECSTKGALVYSRRHRRMTNQMSQAKRPNATDDFIRYVENNMIPNCPVTKSDILRAEDIFGKNIGTLKERIRAIANQLPFEAYPHRLIVEMVYNVIFWINIFPHKDGIHDYISPHMNITGLRIDHKKHCKLEFGTYVHVHKEHDNSLMPRTTGAIALRPTGNSQGSHYFLNLNSGHCIVRNHWTTLPMPAEVIHNVHRLAAICKKFKGFIFTDKHGNTINDDLPSESDTDSDAF